MFLVTKQILQCWLLCHLEQQHICQSFTTSNLGILKMTRWCLIRHGITYPSRVHPRLFWRDRVVHLIVFQCCAFFTLSCLLSSFSALCTMLSVSFDNHSWFTLLFSLTLIVNMLFLNSSWNQWSNDNNSNAKVLTSTDIFFD